MVVGTTSIEPLTKYLKVWSIKKNLSHMSGPIIIIMTFELDIIEVLVLIFDNLMRLKKVAPGPGSFPADFDH